MLNLRLFTPTTGLWFPFFPRIRIKWILQLNNGTSFCQNVLLFSEVSCLFVSSLWKRIRWQTWRRRFQSSYYWNLSSMMHTHKLRHEFYHLLSLFRVILIRLVLVFGRYLINSIRVVFRKSKIHWNRMIFLSQGKSELTAFVLTFP